MTATLTAAPASRGAQQRAKALAAFLSQLRDPAGASGAVSPIVTELRADPWIHSQIEQAPVASADSAVSRELVAHGCALLAKCHADVELLTTVGARDRSALYTLQAESMLDVAIGTALLREFQPVTDAAVQAGDLAQAKGLNQLGHRIRKAVAVANQVISDAGRSDAEKLVDAMTEQPCEERPVVGTLDQVAREIDGARDQCKARAGIRRELRAKVRLPTRTELLVVSLACCLLLWVGLVRLPRYLDPGPGLIERDEFPDAIVLEVVARPPSLYVTLDAAAWQSADLATRESVAAEVASVPLVDDDYRGALIRTSDGRPVASWSRSTGVRLLEAAEPVASPEAAQKTAVFVP